MYIGVDLGGTGIKVGIVDENANILAKDSVPTRANDGYDVIVKDMHSLIQKTLKEADISIEDIKSIGIGSPGFIDSKNGVVRCASNLDMINAPLCDELKKYIDKPVFLANDANCAALGEFYAYENQNSECFIAVTLGTGVGGGIIINGKIYDGPNGAAGELGHMVIYGDGEKCGCGRKGCWEAYASATALIRDTEKAAKENPASMLSSLIAENGGKANGKIPFDAAKAGDEVALKVVDNYTRYIAEGLANLVNIFQPEVIVIGGGISKEGDYLIAPVNKYVEERKYKNSTLKFADIKIAKLGNDAGIIGAAFLGK